MAIVVGADPLDSWDPSTPGCRHAVPLVLESSSFL